MAGGDDGMDHGLVKRMRAEVGDRLAEQRRRDAATGVAPMSGEDERQFARALIEITAGRAPAGAQEEEELAAAVHAALFGVGRLQPLLDDPQIENIDINGCDRVFLGYADGGEVMADPVAESDEELIELIQALAAYSGRSSRPCPSGVPGSARCSWPTWSATGRSFPRWRPSWPRRRPRGRTS